MLLAGALAASLTGSVALSSGQAVADPRPPKPPAIPSQSDVEAARRAAGDKAGEVAAIEQRLAGANTRLENLGIAAGKAAEVYNGALYRLQKARTDAAAATLRAAKAQTTAEQQRRQIGRFAAASYQGGGQIAQLGPLFTADGPQTLLDNAGTANSVSAAMQGAYLRYTAAKVVANAFRMQADAALAEVKKATEAAAAAKRSAEAAVAEQSAAVASIGTDRHRLITQLAQLRKTSYAVAEQRQRGLEELARQKAAAEARRKAAEQQRRAAIRAAAEAAARAREAAALAVKAKAAAARRAAERAERAAQEAREAHDRKAREAAARRAEQAAEEAERESHKPSKPSRPSKPSKPSKHKSSKPKPSKHKPSRPKGGGGSSDGPSTSRGGVSAVIAYAKAQLGEPYVWAAAGPDEWDCSGLTMKAWRKAGVSLPHYSVAQYEQTRHISADELRAGDLIFWADDPGNPGTIFHVALYIGGGQMIHAPRPGRPVTIDSVYYWKDPTFYGRP